MSLHDRLRIALFTYATQPRGGVLHALALGEALSALGHDVTLYALDTSGTGFVRPPRCPYVLIPCAAAGQDILAFVQGAIGAYVDALDRALPDYDIYHAHDGISANALATLVERGRIAGFVRTVHHLDDFGRSPLAALQDRSVRTASGCLVVSELWRERVAQTYAIAATVVSNGVDRERFRPVPPAQREFLRATLGAGAGPLFVTIGGIEARKNTLATLESFALVREQLPAARLVIAGGASIFDHSAYRRAFDTRAEQLGLRIGADVTIAGVLSDEGIVTLVRAAHAVVFPSVMEGFGLVILEALACGTPVVTSAIPPFTEFLTPADAALVDPFDFRAIAAAMLRALQPSVIAAAAVRGPALAARYSWSTCAQAQLAAYGLAGVAATGVLHA